MSEVLEVLINVRDTGFQTGTLTCERCRAKAARYSCPGRKMPSVMQRGDMMLLLAIASDSRDANRPIQGDRRVPLSSVAQHLALAGTGFSA